jgi:hypothetical protein
MIALMALCVIATAWFPLASITALPSRNYNEGWNAYRQWMTIAGQPLYGRAPSLWTTNYPFLSFHIIGYIGAVKANMVLAGRIVCFAALVAISGLAGAIVRGATASRPGAIYAGLCLFAGLAAFNGSGRACNEPDLLSLAFACFGLFAYLRAPPRMLWLAGAAIAFAVSLFIKHDILAMPLSVAAHLLVTRNWRGLAAFLAAGGLAAGALLALSFHLDGRDFFGALLQPRAYSLQNLGTETFHYLLHFLAPLAVGVTVLLRHRAIPNRGFFFTLLIFTNLAAVYFSGGDGVASNIFYPASIADLLACVIAICWLEQEALQTPRAGRGFETALIVTSLAGALMVPFQFHNDIAAAQQLPATAQAARQAVAILQSANGPVICEDLLLCYDAGKPLDYDAYYVKDQILTGRVRDADIVALLNAHYYAAIQVDGGSDPVSLKHRRERFTLTFLRALAMQYRPVLVTHNYSVFVPRG